MPGASELFFRSTSTPASEGARSAAENGRHSATAGSTPVQRGNEKDKSEREKGVVSGARRSTARTKHDAKITVYISQDELLALEHARLALRGSHDVVVDRGRLVREAVAVMLGDFEEHGEDSVLVRRLRAEDDLDEERTAG